MNYYNPYFYTMPLQPTNSVGFFGRLFRNNGINFGNILNGTQKVLNFANQAIPLVKEVRPIIGNAKTMFKVMNEFKKVEKPALNANKNFKKNNEMNINLKKEYSNVPQFFA